MRYFIYRLLAEFFVAGSFTLLILLILEDFAPGVVTLWLNLRLLVLIVGLTGILSLLFSKDYDKVK